MAHAQKPEFIFRRNGRVHLNRRRHQFSQLLEAEVCASAVVMLDTPYSEVVWRVLATHYFASFPFTSPPVCHHVPSHFNWNLPHQLRPLSQQYTVCFFGMKKKQRLTVCTWCTLSCNTSRQKCFPSGHTSTSCKI